jgi:Flp pilus assembly secretin CpaC
MPETRTLRRTGARRILPTVLLCGFAYCGTVASETPPTPPSERLVQIGATTQRLDVGDADSVLVQFPDWLTRVRSTDASVVRVTAVRPDRLRITRLAEGRTTLTALDRQQREYSVELSWAAASRR